MGTGAAQLGRLEGEADHWPPSSPEVKKVEVYVNSPICRRGVHMGGRECGCVGVLPRLTMFSYKAYFGGVGRSR